MIEKAFAEQFASHWIDAWNSHDIDRILSHYVNDFVMHSPAIVRVAGENSGMLKGKDAVGAYWRKALAILPDLAFELLGTFIGADSVALCYKGVNGRLVVETFHFGTDNNVLEAYAHYST